jgi:hypothetical protein
MPSATFVSLTLTLALWQSVHARWFLLRTYCSSECSHPCWPVGVEQILTIGVVCEVDEVESTGEPN